MMRIALYTLLMLFCFTASAQNQEGETKVKEEKPELIEPQETTSAESETLEILETEEYQDEGEVIYKFVEEMPSYVGGEEAVRDFVSSTFIYPLGAIERFVEGRVYLKFVVEIDGSITRAEVHPLMRWTVVDDELAEEALRLLNAMPNWSPGKSKGREVRCSHSWGLTFSLE